MPPRLELTPEQMLERVREQTRRRVAKHRAGNVTAPQRSNVTPPARNVTPPGTARTRTSRSQSESVTTTTQKDTPLAAVPKPNKSAEVIDRLRAGGLPDLLTKADHQAIKASPLSAAQLVEAFGEAFWGRWGGEWLQQNLTMQAVIKRYPGFLAWKNRPAAGARDGLVVGGAYHPPAAFQKNTARTFKVPEDYSPEQLDASDRERERVWNALPERLRGKSRWRSG